MSRRKSWGDCQTQWPNENRQTMFKKFYTEINDWATRTPPKKIVERGKIATPNTHIQSLTFLAWYRLFYKK